MPRIPTQRATVWYHDQDRAPADVTLTPYSLQRLGAERRRDGSGDLDIVEDLLDGIWSIWKRAYFELRRDGRDGSGGDYDKWASTVDDVEVLDDTPTDPTEPARSAG